jgi:hypothetical protein
VSHSRQKSLAKRLQPAEWLPRAFFDRLDYHHAEWSLTSFLSWLTITRPHVHRATETVYGGPLGVRVLAFALSRILQNMDFARSGVQVPNDIIGVIKGPRRNWSAEHAEHEVARCIEVLSRDVQRSRTILQVTFAARASTWKHSVRLALLDREGTPNAPESGVSATSGVPNGLRVLREMVHAIDEMENEASHEEIDFEVSRVSSMRRIHPQRSQDRSGSGEYIHISNISAWSEPDDTFIRESHSRERQQSVFTAPDTLPDPLHACTDREPQHEDRDASDGNEEQHDDNAFMLSGNFTQVRLLQRVFEHDPFNHIGRFKELRTCAPSPQVTAAYTSGKARPRVSRPAPAHLAMTHSSRSHGRSNLGSNPAP